MNMINIRPNPKMTRRKAELIKMMEESPNMVKFSMNMPAMLHHDLAIIAIEKKMKMSHIINQLVLGYVHTHTGGKEEVDE